MLAPSRVVVTGAGILTAHGNGWAPNALGFRRGALAFRQVTLFDVSRRRAQRAAEVDLPACPATRLSAKQERRLDRAAKLLLHAGHQAWNQAGAPDVPFLPLVLGTSSGGMRLGEQFYEQAIRPSASRRKQAGRSIFYQAQRPGVDLAAALGLNASVTVIANACASGANAIGHGWSAVRHGRTPIAVVGGYDALTAMVFGGFDSLQALSPTSCRPFDEQRDGLALGEGAAVLVLEAEHHARQRGATMLAELCGYGAATDLHHLTQPQPEGAAAVQSMTAACRVAGISAAQVDYLNAHGTGTPLNDAAETGAINRWADEFAPQLRVSSTKSGIGHLLGAAGAVEAVVCLMALENQWFPPTSTTQHVDSRCRFRLVRQPEDGRVEFALSNSFGFGGANASLLFRRISS